MKGFVAPLVPIAIIAVVLGILFWSPWDAHEREREITWIEAYAAWTARIDRELRRSRAVSPSACRARFDERVGPAPTSRLEATAVAARNRCRAAVDAAGWRNARWRVVSALIDGHAGRAATTREPGLSRIAASIADRKARVFCWLEGDWNRLAEHFASVRGDEFWVMGLADVVQGRIDLASTICDRLRAYERRIYPAPLTLQNLELAEALVVLAHEAEHLRVPEAPEAVVECYALQRVRGLIREGGRGRAYQDEIAGLALDIAYPNLPDEYRTNRCHDGGPLDLRPGSRVWP